MNFEKISSKVEGEHPSSGVTRQANGKGFRMVSCQSVIRVRKMIQNPSSTMVPKFYHTSCRLGKS
jgi:hypothetical protein